MILAAGRGERMGELTRDTPKPLLQVNGHYLIEYALANVKRAGIHDVVINVSYHREQMMAALGDGSRYGLHIIYSEEPERLETGGGILQALPLLGSDPFLLFSSDVITDFSLQHLPTQLSTLAHLVLVDNPTFLPQGDFGLQAGKVSLQARPYLTYANIGVYSPALFEGCRPGHFKLNTLLFPAIEKGFVSGEYFHGTWCNIGTPEQLSHANLRAQEDSNLRPLASETNTLSN